MSWVPIARLLADGRPSADSVAIRGGVGIAFGRFQADVAAALAQLEGCTQAALACEDSYLFAVGLLALLHVGAEVMLPPNTQPGTLGDLGVRVVDDAMLAACPAAQGRFAPLDAERAKIIFHTSGSTGAPKRIEKTLGMQQRESEALHAVWGARLGRGPVLATVSHQHLYGLAFRLLWPLSAGVVFDAVVDAVWETLLAKLRGDAVIISSPAHLGRLAGLEPVAASLRPSLIFSAGAPLSIDAARASQAILGVLPTEIFGSTETGAMATRQQSEGDEAWGLLPGAEIRLDAAGRMAVRSPYVDGWQQTEDLVERVADGFRFLGRADRIVKVEGKRVDLLAIEAALMGLPWVEAAAVVAMPGLPTRLGGLLVLTVAGHERLRASGPFQFGRLLRRALSAQMEPAGLPRVWRFADALPARALGKRHDAAIVSLFEASHP